MADRGVRISTIDVIDAKDIREKDPIKQPALGNLGELAEDHLLDLAEGADLRVHGAQRSHRLAVAREQRDADIGTHVLGAAHEQIIRETRIGGGIANDERLAGPDHVVAQRAAARRLAYAETDA